MIADSPKSISNELTEKYYLLLEENNKLKDSNKDLKSKHAKAKDAVDGFFYLLFRIKSNFPQLQEDLNFLRSEVSEIKNSKRLLKEKYAR